VRRLLYILSGAIIICIAMLIAEKKYNQQIHSNNQQQKNTPPTPYTHSTSAGQDEKFNLVGTLASTASNTSNIETSKSTLSKIFSIAINDDDAEVRSYAVMVYSRLGDPTQAINLLKSSLLNKTIDDDTYYSELARIYFSSHHQDNNNDTILEEIIISKSSYTAEVIFSILPESDLSRLSSLEVGKLKDYLQISRPKFPSDFTSLGIIDTLTYTNWIRSIATLYTGKNDPETITSYLLNHFEKGFQDPREAVSLTLNNSFSKTNRSANAIALNKLLQEETLRYAESYPDNPVIQVMGIRGKADQPAGN